MNVLRTIRANLPTLLAFLVIAAVFSVAADIVTSMSIRPNMPPGLSNLVNCFTGFTRFFGAAFCVDMFLIIAWPVFNRYFNKAAEPDPSQPEAVQIATKESILTGFASLTPQQRFLTIVGSTLLLINAASHCF